MRGSSQLSSGSSQLSSARAFALLCVSTLKNYFCCRGRQKYFPEKYPTIKTVSVGMAPKFGLGMNWKKQQQPCNLSDTDPSNNRHLP